MTVRKAIPNDIPALGGIYNYEVLNGTATFDITPKSYNETEAWFYMHNKENHPLITAVDENGAVLGYASLSAYREKEAYSSCVELSVYVEHNSRKKGIATALMSEILRLAKEDERTHSVISVITSNNEASKKLHQNFGFSFCGRLNEIGIKFGKYLSVDNYYLEV